MRHKADCYSLFRRHHFSSASSQIKTCQISWLSDFTKTAKKWVSWVLTPSRRHSLGHFGGGDTAKKPLTVDHLHITSFIFVACAIAAHSW